jgi:hypothetical protein
MNRQLRGLLYFLGFQKDGQPKIWLRHLLLRDQRTGEPRRFAERIIFIRNGSLRPVLADWYEKYHGNASRAEFAQHLGFIRGESAGGHLGRAGSLHIVSPQHTEIVAEALADCLSATRLSVTRGTSMPEPLSHDLYLVVAPQVFERLPPPDRTVLMQMEQVKASTWVTPDYLRQLNNSLAILDYSRDNIESLVRRGIPAEQVFHVPLLPYKSGGEPANDRDIDILFYGSMASHRRKTFVEALSGRFNVRVETSLFGEDLRNLLSRTRIVVNIHYYENAILETTRILESVRYGARVVSETARDQADYGSLSPLVTFVPCGDIPAFLDAVDMQLSQWESIAPAALESGFREMKRQVLRAFNAIGVLETDELLSENDGAGPDPKD